MRFIFLIAALSIASAVVAAEPPKSLRPGMTYPQARAALIGEGWRPVPTRHDPRAFKSMCHENPGVCVRYPEVVRCGYLGACEFLFEHGRDGDFLEVSTRSGRPPRLRSSML